WYTPVELLTILAQRDGTRWALPETLAGRAWVGKEAKTEAVLDAACEQWGLSWTRSNGVLVVHRGSDERLKRLTAALAEGGRAAGGGSWVGGGADALWLGWRTHSREPIRPLPLPRRRPSKCWIRWCRWARMSASMWSPPAASV